jgi:hypothetical protein
MLRAKVDTTEIDRGLAAMTQEARNLGPAWKEARKPMRADQRDHARRREGPDGPWAPKAASTRAREALARKRAGKRRGSRRLLGRLPSAITITADRRRVVARSRARGVVSGTHQDGGTAGRGARIPARVFLWASESLLNVVAGIIEKHILGRW